jgi:hypothetical protein
MDKRSDQIEKISGIFKLKGFIKNNFEDYENTTSSILFKCDRGHDCLTKVRYILYDDVGCKTCQYEKKKSILNIELTDTDFKICNSCSEKKNRSCYGKLKSSSDGLRSTCKLCRRKKHLSECDVNFIKRRDKKSLKYFKEKPFRVLLSRCKSNHNKKGMIGFNITEEFLRDLYYNQNGKCYWSNMDLPLDNVGLGELNSISIDRLDCTIGYDRNNVVISSKFYNIGRGNMNVDDFKKFLIDNNLLISKNLLK